MAPLLGNQAYTPQPGNIAYADAAFKELLDIRYSSELFRMASFKEVQQNLTFLNTGQNQTPGLIVMKLDANRINYRLYKHVVVVFNATDAQVEFTDARLQGLGLRLHPVQADSSDPVTRESTYKSNLGRLTVRALMTAVFVSERE